MSELVHYLLVFDRDKGRLVHREEFADGKDRGARAAAAYADMEKLYQGQARIDVVLIGSDSIDTIRQTHANYFHERPMTVSELLAAT